MKHNLFVALLMFLPTLALAWDDTRNIEAEQMPATAAAGAASVASGGTALAGVWYGIASTVGQIELAADGAYRYNGEPGGHWRQEGDRVVFDGALSAWNQGVASLKEGVLEFYWTNAEGFNNWFVFQR